MRYSLAVLLMRIVDTDELMRVGRLLAAEVDDVAKLKELVSTGQLAGKGITAFAVQGSTAVFFQGTRDEVTTAKATVHGATLHVMEEEPVDDAACRMMSCVEGEGLPSPNDPMASGNLFLSLNVVFPTAIDPAAVAAVTAALGPPLNQPTWRPTDPAVETHLIKMAGAVVRHSSLSDTPIPVADHSPVSRVSCRPCRLVRRAQGRRGEQRCDRRGRRRGGRGRPAGAVRPAVTEWRAAQGGGAVYDAHP